MSEKIIIFDTSLRDGEQSLQASLSVREKLKIAFALERMKVDIMEVGFPISSPGDFNSVREISKNIKNTKICSLARCLDQDIDVAADAMSVLKDFRIHIFLGTSHLHMKYKLKKKFDDILNMAIRSIKRAKRYTNDIQFSCEDAGRTSMDNLCKIVEQVIHHGATTINIPDTVGYTLPNQFGDIIHTLYERVPNIDQAVVSVHCHNDLGMAVGNSISAILSGARQVEGTINGIGERAGNAALEEIIMAIISRKDILKVHTTVESKEIYNTSKIISKICNIPIPNNKAIVGKNAFSHSSGIHQDGVLKNRKNYEIISPKTIGWKNVQFNLTSRSGRAAVRHRMKNMGYKDNEYDINKLYESFLKLADKKGQVFDYDLESLAFIKNQNKNSEYFRLQDFNVQSNCNGYSSALVKLICGKKIVIKSATTNNGSVDAVYQALHKISGYSIFLKNFQLIAKGQGKETLGQVDIIVKYNNRTFHGLGLSTDIIESSAKAMINVLNSIWRSKQVSLKFKKLES
ncbi:2-isopropylmalate synthase [Buchnera aphidicola]|uniref:2-isopropylmalate synthase n=1 Tax=Buchnera aphidicola TaxID=9 RepID=UPI0034641F3C